jgi:hypothetical protein
MAKPVKKRKGNVDTVDFAGVKSGGGAAPPEGRYKAKIISAETKEGKESGEPYRDVTWEITSDKCNGREVRFDNYSLQPQALWKLKGLLEAMGVEVPDGEHEVDWDEMIDGETECIIELTHDKRENGTFARVTGVAPLSDGNTVDDNGDEEEEKPVKKGKSKPVEEDEDEEEEPPKKRTKKDEEEGDEEEEQDDEEEDEPKKPSSKKLKKGAKVKFKDEKNKLVKGTIESIDGDQAIVVSDDEDTYEIDTDELTVI